MHTSEKCRRGKQQISHRESERKREREREGPGAPEYIGGGQGGVGEGAEEAGGGTASMAAAVGVVPERDYGGSSGTSGRAAWAGWAVAWRAGPARSDRRRYIYFKNILPHKLK